MSVLSALGWALFNYVSVFCAFTIFGVYAIQHIICGWFFRTQNLKARYNAQWAVVTGASSGIGKAIATRLAQYKLNVVLVALGDQLLDSTFAELQERFPAQQFRKVAADLGGNDYLSALAEATKDIDVQIVFCNAGYMLSGFFYGRTIEALEANHNCNATSAMKITHLFVQRMVHKKLKGCVVYTSSAAACLPSPSSVLYAATKAYLAAFAASLAAEVKPKGIDILVFFPSPVASRFYDKAAKMKILEFFKKQAVSPEALPDTVFASVGRTVFRDVGPVAYGFRSVVKIIDYGFLAWIMSLFGKVMGADFTEAAAKADADLASQMAAQ